MDLTPDAPLPPAAGRTCPLHYRYGPAVFRAPARLRCDTLYVVGGLYGNEGALQAVLDLYAAEPGVAGETKRLVFNGDFHWFDTDPAAFARITTTVLAHDALRGNVETELADDAADAQAGCGCAYPDWVGHGVVERSNRIHARLRQTALAFPVLRQRLAALPMWLRADVGPLALGIVHGDAQSLAGWGFAQEHLRDATHRAEVLRWFDTAAVDAFACSHTCLPLFHTLTRRGQAGARHIFNNGAAGMPNFAGDHAGLFTRIALTRMDGPERRFGTLLNLGDVTLHVDAVAVEPQRTEWQAQFLTQWPAGSDAHTSYWDRITAGPDYTAADALLTTED